MKYLIVLCVFLLLLPFVIAGEKQVVKSGTYKPGEVFTIEETLRIEVADLNNQNAVTLNIGEERVKVNEGDCIERNAYEICLTAVSQSDQKHPRFDIFLYNYIIDVYRAISRITVEQQPERTKVSKGDKMKVIVTLQNHGEKKATDITWSQTLVGFSAYDTKDGCFFSGNKVGWSGTLFPDRTVSCSYYIQATSPGKHELLGILQWTDEEVKTIETKLKLTVAEYELVLTPRLEKPSLVLGETTDLILNYKNILEKDTIDNIVTTISFQPGITITPAEPTFQKPHGLRWNDFLRLLEEKEVKIHIKGDSYGYYTIPIEVQYEAKDKNQGFTEQIVIEVKPPTLSFSAQPSEIQSGEEITLKITAANPNEDNIENAKITLESDLWEIPFTWEKASIERGESLLVTEEKMTVPYTDSNTTKTLKVKGMFLYQGQLVNVQEEIPLTILPKKDIMIEEVPVEEAPILEENVTNTTTLQSQEEAKEEYQNSKMKQIIIGVAAILIIIAGFIVLQWWQKHQQEQKIIKGKEHHDHPELMNTEERKRQTREDIANEVKKLMKK
ncbi:hypothetical protein J4410_05885 [Candidatus Woesearchaeota archaeon]|nr:hypothetical protein [Candidatus Woesearchaeota archaeon]